MAFFFTISDFVFSSGSIYMKPEEPSTIAYFPSNSGFNIPFTEIKAGIPIVRAKIAVCDMEEPFSVTNARIFDLSSCMVSLGARSSAAKITASPKFCEDVPPLLKFEMTRSDISLTSAARSRI